MKEPTACMRCEKTGVELNWVGLCKECGEVSYQEGQVVRNESPRISGIRLDLSDHTIDRLVQKVGDRVMEELKKLLGQAGILPRE